MKIKLNKEQEDIARKFLEVKEFNISAAEIYIEYLNEHYDDITDFDVNTLNGHDRLDIAFYKSFLKAMRIHSKEKEYIDINNNSHLDTMRLLDPNDYLNDEYAKIVGFPKVINNEWQLTSLNYLPYEGFVYDELSIDDEFYQETTPFGFFDTTFKYLAVIQEETIWMSVIPHEINTMKKPIKDAYGNVLVLGLGLGYFPFHISNKEDVDKITIIENDEQVINLFMKHILPKFPHKEKIQIVKEDAFKYLENAASFDFVFADIWHNVGDGLKLYLLIKKYEATAPNTKFEYWIETSLLAMLRRQTLTVFEEQYFGGLKEKDYLRASNENDQIINAIYFATKDYQINNAKDLHDLLNEDSLKALAKVLILK
jgi:predicted methyltransferase